MFANIRKALNAHAELTYGLAIAGAGVSALLALIKHVPCYWIPALFGVTLIVLAIGVRAIIWAVGITRPRDNWSSYDFLRYISNESRAGKGIASETSLASPIITEVVLESPISDPALEAAVRLNKAVNSLLEPSQRLADDIREKAYEGRLKVWAKQDRYGAIHEELPQDVFLTHDFEYLAANLGSARRPDTRPGDLDLKISPDDNTSGNEWVCPRFCSFQVIMLWPPKRLIKSAFGLKYLTQTTKRPIVRA